MMKLSDRRALRKEPSVRPLEVAMKELQIFSRSVTEMGSVTRAAALKLAGGGTPSERAELDRWAEAGARSTHSAGDAASGVPRGRCFPADCLQMQRTDSHATLEARDVG